MDVQRNSRPQRLGLDAGNVVIAINGHRIHSNQHYMSLLRRYSTNLRLDVQEVRSGGVVTLREEGYGGGVAAKE